VVEIKEKDKTNPSSKEKHSKQTNKDLTSSPSPILRLTFQFERMPIQESLEDRNVGMTTASLHNVDCDNFTHLISRVEQNVKGKTSLLTKMKEQYILKQQTHTRNRALQKMLLKKKIITMKTTTLNHHQQSYNHKL